MVSCKSSVKEVSFERSHHRILSADLKVRTTLHVSIIDSVSEKGEDNKENLLTVPWECIPWSLSAA